MTVTADDYARAESLQANRLLTEAIFNCSFTPVAIAGSNTFWYRVTTSEGPRFKFVDADNGTAREAFDHEAVAKKLGEALGQQVTAATVVTGNDARPVWMPEAFLLENEVTPWMDLPMWLPEEAKGMMQVSVARAEEAGLTPRPLEDTIADLLDWHHGDPDKMALGLKADKESELLAKWASTNQ